MSNDFDFLKSKIRELHIPLPNYKYFHKPSSEEDVSKNFIGREDISEQLEEWLTHGDSGAYLVSGYRGMGKSSFVGKVLNRITRKTKNNRKVQFFTTCCSIFIFTSVLFVFLLFNESLIKNLSFSDSVFTVVPVLCVVSFFSWVLILFFDSKIIIETKEKRRRKKLKIDETSYKNHKTWFEKVFGIKDYKKSKHNLVIKLNLGHETLREKDILSLIAKRIYESYKKYVNDFYTNWLRIPTKTILLFVGAILIVSFLDAIDITTVIIPKNEKIRELSNVNTVISANEKITENTGINTIFSKNENYFKNNNLSIIQNLTLKIIDKNEINNIPFLSPKLIFLLVLTVLFYFVVKRIFYFVIFYIPFLYKHSTKAILEQLKFLTDRIEAAVTENSGPNTGYTHSTAFFSFNFSRRKNKTYPNASTREIEDELIQILKKIQEARSLTGKFFDLLDRIFHKKLGFHQAPKFIIVFDELDKIDPVYNNAVKTEHNIPEFESSTAFQGGSVSRDRKQNVLKLLGNMKLFMSQAEAKFVFISGRELYDAFLADLADREFAASSIFNGVIYVDSFLQSSTKQKNIITKTEEYICGYLIPKDWYSNNAKYQYNKETGKDDDIQHKYKLENITYRYPNLRMYKTFLIRTLINSFLFEILRDSSFKGYGENGNDVILDNDGVILDNFCVKKLFEKIKDLTFDNNKEFGDYEIKINNIPRKLRDILNLKFESYKDFENIVIKTINTFSKSRNEIEYKELFEEKLHDIEQLFQYVDKVVVFLNQFSIYLTHICNGSPKKITIYFEQYIKSFIPEHLKNPFSKCQNKDIRESHYCLSFTAIDQQNIGFINYVTYPIIQSVINQTSHFGDKMLVSVSFLIDHIFKHHKGGFSYENIEHTPELLEVYHIPNLRNTIDAILSFLRQNHVANICGGVYQYKFRRPIADEIMYNSRISEEISAIFNFTLDESLPVKRYYYKQIEYNEKKYLELEKRNVTGIIKNQYAITLISQLEILAEIYLLDEENNEAIQHFNTAYEIIKSELQKYNKESENEDKNKLHLFVLLIRIALKLGLAEEFKGYYDEAFALYNSLLGYLVGFRYLDDSELGLGYFYEDNRINNGDGEWKVKKIKLFHNIFGHTVKKNGCYDRDSFYTQEVLPFYRQNQHIRNQKIDFLIDGDYSATGLSKVLSPKKQDIISRLTLFSEVKPIFQAILANLFVVEKIDVNGITQENLDLAEDQFKYIYLLTDSKDKFIQAADFYKKMASILFLKNYSNAKKDEYLQMWGFDIYEAINEFCFINSNNRERIVDKFPKEILKEFFIDNIDKSWDVFIKKTNNINHLIDKLISDSKRKQDNPKYREIIEDFVEFGIEKRDKHIEDSELGKCIDCYACCSDRKLNHPCYACNYVSKSLDIFRRVFVAKKSHASPDLAESHRKYTKRESHFFKLLEFFTVEKTTRNNLFVLASALRIKADAGLSCANETDEITLEFLTEFFNFLKEYYKSEPNKSTPNKSAPTIIDTFIKEKVEKVGSKLEESILYYWLSAEYFYLNNSPVDSSECLTKIIKILVEYIAIRKEMEPDFNKHNPFFREPELLKYLQNTIIKKVIRNNNVTNDDVNFIELQNLKFILRNRPIMRINLSNLSTTANIEDALFSYCRLEIDSMTYEKYKEIKKKKDYPIYFDCYKSNLVSQNRLSFTIHEKIVSLEFKERMNRAIFKFLFEKDSSQKLTFYAPFFPVQFFSFLDRYFTEDYKITEDIKYITEFEKFENKIDTKISLLTFLISDSLYCLTQIIEVLSSGKFSSFSHSFIGDIYINISKWSRLYQLTYAVLPQYNKDNQSDIESFKKAEIKTMCARRKIEPPEATTEELEKMSKDFSQSVHSVLGKLKDQGIKNRIFETNILNDIGTDNRHFLVQNYSVAMALKHYHKTLEVHSEGKEYKEMIKKMYIIDDDISNGMHNFSLALERYAMNCGVINKKMNVLRTYYENSLSYPLGNYLRDTSEYQWSEDTLRVRASLT